MGKMEDDERKLRRKIAHAVIKAMECAEPHEWNEFDIFSGRIIRRVQSIERAKEFAVNKVLDDIWPEVVGTMQGVPF